MGATVEQAIHRWAHEVTGLPFVWGETDCCILTLRALSLLTGQDHTDAYIGAWQDEAAALAHYAIERPSDVLQSFGAFEVDIARVVFGDVLTVPADPWPEQCHFVLGRFCLASDLRLGVMLLPVRMFLSRAGVRLWRVARCLKPSHC